MLAEITAKVEFLPARWAFEPRLEAVHRALMATYIVAYVFTEAAFLTELVINVFAAFMIVAYVAFE